jgi:acetoacetate decarboxylase
MLYSLGREELEKLTNVHFLSDFPNAEMLVATFKTDIEIARQILPHPLNLTSEGLATVFVARYPETNFGCVYDEGALFIHCKYRGENGVYCLSMPVTDDMALIGGREQFGYPKKIAESISLERMNDNVVGSVTRKGVEILRIECSLEKETSENLMDYLAEPIVDWDGVLGYKVISFLFKFFQSPSGGFDYLPRLVREPILFRPQGEIFEGKGKVTLTSTSVDPLGEVPVGDIVEIFYGKWHNTMLPGKVVTRTWNPMKFLKHAFFKTDTIPTLLANYDAGNSERAKEILKIAKSL